MVSNYQLFRIQTHLGNDLLSMLVGMNLILLNDVGRATLIVGGTISWAEDSGLEKAKVS